MNTYGNIFRLTTAGESHGPAMVAIIDGLPAGIAIDMDAINREMAMRRPGEGAAGASRRHESDRVTLLSGIFEGVSTGHPIAMSIANEDARPGDYDRLRNVYRPSHADFTYERKYGVRDHRGGGRSSARETSLRVAAGSIALQALAGMGVDVVAYTSRIGNVKYQPELFAGDMDAVYAREMRCPDAAKDAEMSRLVKYVQEAGDSIGGIVTGVIRGLPVGLGEPVYNKFHAMLAGGMMSINGAKGFDYGMGFDGVCRLGSEMNDSFVRDDNGSISTLTNHSGGVQGGITNGRAVVFRVAFKPVATLMREMRGIDSDGNPVLITPGGRHDACIVPRAVAVVRAMAAMTVLDSILMANAAKL